MGRDIGGFSDSFATHMSKGACAPDDPVGSKAKDFWTRTFAAMGYQPARTHTSPSSAGSLKRELSRTEAEWLAALKRGKNAGRIRQDLAGQTG